LLHEKFGVKSEEGLNQAQRPKPRRTPKTRRVKIKKIFWEKISFMFFDLIFRIILETLQNPKKEII
jgi:hypothetical protein